MWLLVIGVVIGVVFGWFLRRFAAPTRAELDDTTVRIRCSDRRADALEAERDAERAEVVQLRSALRSERELIDGVAADAGIDVEAFRRTLARRPGLVSPPEPNDGPEPAAEPQPTIAPEIDALVGQVSDLRADVTAKDHQLAEARHQIRSIRADLESLASGRAAGASPSVTDGPATNGDRHGADGVVLDLIGAEPVLDLTDTGYALGRARSVAALESEVARLRARLADVSVSRDDLRHRIEHRRAIDRRLADLVEQLDLLRNDATSEGNALRVE